MPICLCAMSVEAIWLSSVSIGVVAVHMMAVGTYNLAKVGAIDGTVAVRGLYRHLEGIMQPYALLLTE